MKAKHFLSVLFFLFSIDCIHAQNTDSELNLDFEIVDNGIPKGWIITPPTQGKNFVTLDSVNVKSGKFSIHLSFEDSVRQRILLSLPNKYNGEKMTLSGHIKTENVTNGYAGFNLFSSSIPPIILSDTIRITGTTDWQKYELTVDFSSLQGEEILFGGYFNGKGKAWFDDFNLYLDGENIIDIIDPTPKLLSENEITALKKYIYPLKTYEPDGGDTKDLAILDQLIDNSKVVGLGEVTHGSGVIFKMKNRIIQYLAANHGFDIFSIEANMPESYKLNNYTVRGEGNPKNLIADMYFGIWNTEEVLNMVEWMRRYNQPKQRIEFTGFDMQFYEGAINELLEAFKGNTDFENRIFDLKKKINETGLLYHNKGSVYIDDNKMEDFNSIISILWNNISTSPFQTSEKEWLQQNTVIIRQLMGLYCRNNMPLSDWRDKCMADNLMWIKEHNPNSKIVVWAHNGHIQKTNQKMGYHLVQKLGDDYVTFGFTFYEGSFTASGNRGFTSYDAIQAYPGTLEYLLEQVKEPIFILDMKKIKSDNNKDTEWLMQRLVYRMVGASGENQNEFFGGKISEDFDYLIFIKTSFPSKLLNR